MPAILFRVNQAIRCAQASAPKLNIKHLLKAKDDLQSSCLGQSNIFVHSMSFGDQLAHTWHRPHKQGLRQDQWVGRRLIARSWLSLG
eukprot:548242-Pelagomonas_calceolata.AAC.2